MELNLKALKKQWGSLLLALSFLGLVVFITYEGDSRSCADMSGCKALGLCSGSPPDCEASGDADCVESDACRSGGRCQESDGQCVVASTYCHKRPVCKESGLCSAV